MPESSLIKAEILEDGLSIQAIGNIEHVSGDLRTQTDGVDTSVPPEVVRLRNEILGLEQKITDLETAHHLALESARNETRRICETEYQENENKRLDELNATLSRAEADLRRDLDKLPVLAISMTEIALENLFGNSEFYQDAVLGLINFQLEKIRQESVLSVHVSAKDFGQAAAQSQLQDSMGDRNINLHFEQALDSGEVKIELRLGHIRASVDGYRSELSALFANLSEDSL